MPENTTPPKIPIEAAPPAPAGRRRGEPHRRHPDWLKVRLPGGPIYEGLKSTLRGHGLNTVCEEAMCPNVAECWGRGTATFMILGDVCTRGCRYCAVSKGKPAALDLAEPERVAEAAAAMRLRHVVITSVDRDDLADGGASIFVGCIEAIHDRLPGCAIEVLIPDFRGNAASLRAILDAGPDVLNHNIETVPRLFPSIRLGGDFAVSMRLLERARAIAPRIPTKTGMMLGLGETDAEVVEVMAQLVEVGVEILTLGQYLQPTLKHAPVHRYVHPTQFDALARQGLEMGFRHVEAGPLVRSSYHAESQVAPPAAPTGSEERHG